MRVALTGLSGEETPNEFAEKSKQPKTHPGAIIKKPARSVM